MVLMTGSSLSWPNAIKNAHVGADVKYLIEYAWTTMNLRLIRWDGLIEHHIKDVWCLVEAGGAELKEV